MSTRSLSELRAVECADTTSNHHQAPPSAPAVTLNNSTLLPVTNHGEVEPSLSRKLDKGKSKAVEFSFPPTLGSCPYQDYENAPANANAPQTASSRYQYGRRDAPAYH